MVFVEVCVGSSCHLKGAPEIVERMQKYIAESHLEEEIILSGSFCTGKCNRIGVTVTVDGNIYTGITPDGFRDFWEKTILPAVENAKENRDDRLSDT